MNETTNLLASALFSGFRADSAASVAADRPVRDRFGSRVETQAGRINAALTTVPQTLEAIAKASGESVARVKGHLTYWLVNDDRGLGLALVKTDDGFALKS